MTAMSDTSASAVAGTYLESLGKILDAIDLDAVERLVGLIRRVRDDGGAVYVAGNGGSAATATHWVNDLCKATRAEGQPPIRAMSLTDNTSFVTALANDEGYERIFAGQLETFASPGDLLIVISASGNSPNLVSAVETARRLGVRTVALLGFDGGVLKEKADDFVWLPTDMGAYGLAEAGHSVVTDIVTTCLIQGGTGPAAGERA
jgi:D-sedoheptulose 7-phosphate isomerase